MKKVILSVFILSLLLILLCSCNDTEVPSSDSYEVLSVTAFVEVETNGLGGVFGQWIAYNVNYVDADGNVKIVQISPDNNYRHTLAMGTSDKLEITSENHYTLYLTRNTYSKLTGGIVQ